MCGHNWYTIEDKGIKVKYCVGCGLTRLNNGRLLFDKGLISFDDNGKILISRELGEEEKALVNINEDSCIDINSQKQKDYLKYHRKNIFIK